MHPPIETNQSHRSYLHGPCFAKFLVNNSAAGSLIGKNGITIAATEHETGTVMKLSSTTTFFPNTQDRILTISGSEQSVCKAILLIIDKICLAYHPAHTRNTECEDTMHFLENDPMNARNNKVAKPTISVKLIVPNSSISSIIGKGGSRIRTIQDTLNCRIHVYNRSSGTSERIVASIGELDSLKKAVIALVLIFQNDTNIKEYASVTYPSTPNNHKFSNYIDIVNKLEHSNSICKISINIPEISVNSLLGPNGNSLDQVISSTGIQIKIFPKDPTTSGSNYRKVTLTGSVSAVHTAHALILVKIGGAINNKDALSFDDYNCDMRKTRYDDNHFLNHSYNYNLSSNYLGNYVANHIGNSISNSIDNSLIQRVNKTNSLATSMNNLKLSVNDEINSFPFNDLSSFDITTSREWK